MQLVVFIPGIMGTRLVLERDGAREEVWPPTPLETKFGYARIDKLQHPALKPTEIIDSVLCFPFYTTVLELLRDIGFSEGGADRRLHLFPYDWRQDLFGIVDRLASTLDDAARGADSITLVAHSMGGLIARLLLESETYRGRPWFGRIQQMIALAVPHLGAPLALARVLGLDSTLGIKGRDFARLAANPRYPSGYQLLPPPGEIACWDQSAGALDGLDIHDARTAASLGLSATLLARTQALHDVLSAGRAPAGVRYFYFAGTGHRTVTRVNVTRKAGGAVDPAAATLTWTDDGGDGTVPIYSALPRIGQRQIVTNEHSSVFAGAPFRRVFVRLLGADEGPAVEAAAPSARLTVEQPVMMLGRDIEVNLVLEDAEPEPKLDGRLLVEALADDGGRAIHRESVMPVAYAGPAVAKLTLKLPPIAKAGLYRLAWEGTPAVENRPMFVVAEP
jgi:pimeloyl-ACP methyl ester carboxylesterase